MAPRQRRAGGTAANSASDLAAAAAAATADEKTSAPAAAAVGPRRSGGSTKKAHNLSDGGSDAHHNRGRRRVLLALLLAAIVALYASGAARWRKHNGGVDPVAAAVDHLNDTLRATLNVTLPDLPELDLAQTWRQFNATVQKRLNLSLPDADALPDLVESLLIGLNVSGALAAVGGRFGAAQGGAGGGAGGAGGLRPGQLAAARGLRARHPVVIVPGFVTSGLELWQGAPCAAGYFRQPLWAGGSFSMGRSLLADKACWLAHMALDPATGGDPPGVRLRAARSLDAVDWFVPGYWVFSKALQSLADIGYDSTTIAPLPYDWRLPLGVMEARDAWFSRAVAEIELQASVTGEKVVLVSHSYGAVVATALLDWAERRAPGWAEAHIEAYVNMAGVLLGVPKAIAPLLSGETRDTTELAGGLGFLFDTYLSRAARAQLARTWGSLFAMLPAGGVRIWGNATWAPDDVAAVSKSGGEPGAAAAAGGSEAAGASGGAGLAARGSFGAVITRIAADATSNDGGSNGNDSGSSSNGGADAKAGEPLDVDAALIALAETAGLQFTRNLARWSAAGRRLARALAPILRRHEEAAAAAAEAGAAGGEGRCEAGVCSAAAADAAGGARGECRAPAGSGGCNHDDNDAAAAAAFMRSQREKAQQDGSDSGGGADNTRPDGSGIGSAAAPTSTPAAAAAAEARAATVPLLDLSRAPLPKAPSMTVYCLYGVGAPTERAYQYLHTRGAANSNGGPAAADWAIDTAAADPAAGLESGVRLSDGDGTVPLLSLGALCEGGWRTEALNPGGARVVVREYPHEPVATLLDPRGGPGASTHVEILGNDAALADLLRVVSGAAAAAAAEDDKRGGGDGEGDGEESSEGSEAVRDRIVSRVREVAAAIDWAALARDV